ncbi:MAG: hypothetical protein WBM46_12770 [Polyangiales bacterium]
MTSRRWMGAASGLLVLVAALVFIPGLSDEFTWDDNGLIRTNENIQRPELYADALTTHFWNISRNAAETNETYNRIYRPFVTLAYIVQFRAFGLHARGYRAVSLALHLLCCALTFFWLARRIPNGSKRHRLVAIALGAAVFAFHPSRAEVVSWISGSTELWMCAFVLLGAWAFDRNRSWLAGILLALALFSKETAVVAAPLLLADRFLRDRRLSRGASIALTAPVALALVIRLWMVAVELPTGQARNALPRVLASFGLYVEQVLAPWNPTALPGMRIYTCDSGESLAASWLIAGGLFALALGSLGVAAFRTSSWRPVLADALWFVLPLLPVANLVDLGSRNLTADRFLYLPMLGVSALVARGVVFLLERRPALARLTATALGVVLVGFAVLTSLHSRVFASSSTLWEYEVQRNPENPFALHAVGTARMRAGLRRSGIVLLERAQAVAERTCVHVDQVRAARDLGQALALSLGPDDPAALTNLRAAYARASANGRFAYDGPPSWSVQLAPEEARDLVSDELYYALPLATIEARLGHVDEAMRILSVVESSGAPLDSQSQSLRLQLLAAEDGVGQSLGELGRERFVAKVEGLASVLGTLQETLEQSRVPPEHRANWTRYALGFGQAPSDLPVSGDRSRVILDALRAYSTHAPIDIETLRARIERSRELPGFIDLAQARAQIRALDAQLM